MVLPLGQNAYAVGRAAGKIQVQLIHELRKFFHFLQHGLGAAVFIQHAQFPLAHVPVIGRRGQLCLIMGTPPEQTGGAVGPIGK